jgi:hypothetical protein
LEAAAKPLTVSPPAPSPWIFVNLTIVSMIIIVSIDDDNHADDTTSS